MHPQSIMLPPDNTRTGKGSVLCICHTCGRQFWRSPRGAQRARHCSRQCLADSKKHQDIAQVLLNNRQLDASTGCWLWTKSGSSGYGTVHWKGEYWRVHRIAAVLWLEPPTAEKNFVCHRCDVRACFNPEHLYWGNAADNMRDALNRGRRAVGEQHSRAKVTAEQVREIRTRYAQGETGRVLATAYGISLTATHCIIRRKSWAHIA